MKTIILGIQEYTLPFADLLPDLLPDDYAKLKMDIAERGVIVPVVIDELFAVIDGQHRLKIAAELGLTSVPLEIRTGLHDDEKRQLAWDLNAHRRHMTPEQRKAQEKELAKQGLSLRSIADEMGVSYETVRTDLSGLTTPVKSLTPVTGEVTEVMGKDGKKYRVTKKRTTLVSKPIRTDTDENAAVRKELEKLPIEYRSKALTLCRGVI